MKVSDVMTPNATIASPSDALQDIARIMAEQHLGFLPVGENDRLVGMITDRDIVVRGLAKGHDGKAKVRDCMTEDVKWCFDDDDVEAATRSMAEQQVRRMPVINHDKRLVGVLSLADKAHNGGADAVGAAMAQITKPGGKHAT